MYVMLASFSGWQLMTNKFMHPGTDSHNTHIYHAYKYSIIVGCCSKQVVSELILFPKNAVLITVIFVVYTYVHSHSGFMILDWFGGKEPLGQSLEKTQL